MSAKEVVKPTKKNVVRVEGLAMKKRMLRKKWIFLPV